MPAFRFDRRNRRPPTDPVNALLSFAYSMLARTFTVTLSAVGFDVYRGFYHRPRYGRPALALDLMEPFRPIVADSTVLQGDQQRRSEAGRFPARRRGHRAEARWTQALHRGVRAATRAGDDAIPSLATG